MKAEFSACVKDIATNFVLPEEGQSAAKLKIKKRLKELALPGGDLGTARLASTEIKLVKRFD